MKYKVYNIVKKKFENDIKEFILKPDGRLAVNDYGDETGRLDCIAIFFPDNRTDGMRYVDAIGGVHDSGMGTDPNGIFCGECSNVSCEICPIFNK